MSNKRFATLFPRVLTCAALILTLGGCQTEPAAPEENPQSDLGSTAADACRAPDEPGCNPCCIPQSDGTCRVLSWKPSDPNSGTQPWYHITANRESCPDACRSCARCTRRHEQEIRDLGVRPECDCTKPTGVDPCFGPDTCECYCDRLNKLAQHCPDLVGKRGASHMNISEERPVTGATPFCP